VHSVSDVRKIEMHMAETLISCPSLAVGIAVEKLKRW
jgi:hypothetical protein